MERPPGPVVTGPLPTSSTAFQPFALLARFLCTDQAASVLCRGACLAAPCAWISACASCVSAHLSPLREVFRELPSHNHSRHHPRCGCPTCFFVLFSSAGMLVSTQNETRSFIVGLPQQTVTTRKADFCLSAFS